MEYRVENKYLVSEKDLVVLQGRLQSVISTDIHQVDGSYKIRSLYFDDEWDRCMYENESGIDQRQKYRIRTYNANESVIRLEIKEKNRGLTKKTSCTLSRDEVERIIHGIFPFRLDSRKQMNRLLIKANAERFRPKVIIEYERTAFVCPEGNVRITFDRNIMASRCCTAFFNESVEGMIPVLPTGMHILEVKYDEFLPDYIAGALEIGILQQSAFSKYYLGRLAINGFLL